MAKEKKIAQQDIYCDICDDCIPKGSEYFEEDNPIIDDPEAKSVTISCTTCEEV